MNQLSLNVLGTPQIVLNGEVLMLPRSARATALLVYLALESPHPLPRTTVAALLWPDVGEKQARRNLRQALYEAQRYLKQLIGVSPLQVTNRTIRFLPNAEIKVDVQRFVGFVEQGELERAVALYRGDLMAGFSLSHSEEFDTWLSVNREHLHIRALTAFFQLAEQALERRAFDLAELYARRQLVMEPWREEAHRQLIYALAAQGERSAALAQFDKCAELLARELDASPDEETVTLYRTIQAETVARASIGLGQDGRAAEEPTLEEWAQLPVETRAALARSGVFGRPRQVTRANAVTLPMGALVRAKLTYLFHRLDTNNRGRLNVDDFRSYAGRVSEVLGLSLTDPRLRQANEDMVGWGIGMCKMVDLDGDGYISQSEWLTYWAAWLGAVNGEIAQGTRFALKRFEDSFNIHFVLFDQDGDGAISANEYKTWLQAWGIGPQADSFSVLDVDGDGKLRQAEFMVYLRQFFFTNDPDAPGNHVYGFLPGARDDTEPSR